MVVRCRSAPSMWWKSAQALNCGPNRHMCWPERAQKISLFSSSSVIPPSLSWFPPMVYYYGIIASICLSSHRVDRNQEQKTVRVRKKKRTGGISLSNTNTSSLLPPHPSLQNLSSDLIKMLQSHFPLSVQNLIIQHDSWTASCTIRNSTAPKARKCDSD